MFFAVLANSFSISSGCCLFYSFCGDGPSVESAGQPIKHAICHRLLGFVGTASDFPAYRQWVIYHSFDAHADNSTYHTVRIVCAGGNLGV